MKKILIACMCLFLIGCQPLQAKKPSSEDPKTDVEDKLGWAGEYRKGDLVLLIRYESEIIDGFEFDISLFNGKGIIDEARYISDDKKEAIFDREEGHTIIFTLKDDRILIEESGLSYLEVDASGEYIRK